MPFENSITGGQGSLVRPSIKSPNFVSGSTGWSINRDGTAEFNGVTVRGDFEIGNATTHSLWTATIPAELVAAYPGLTWVSVQINQIAAGVYTYHGLLNDAGAAVEVFGMVSGFVVTPIWLIDSADGAVVFYQSGSSVSYLAGSNLAIAGGYTIDGNQAPRGWLDGVVVTTGGTLVTTSGNTQKDIPNLKLTATLQAGRQYGVFCQARYSITGASTTDQFQMALRHTTALTGTLLATAEFGTANSLGTPLWFWPFPSPGSGSFDLFISVTRSSGATDTCSILGAASGTTTRTWAGICDLTASGSFRTS